jgi:hypothetical protein
MPATVVIIYPDALAYSSPVRMTDMSINARLKMEEKHDEISKGMRRMDAKYEELSCRAS